jgi:hypothetical protein
LVEGGLTTTLKVEHLGEDSLQGHNVTASTVAGVKTTTAFPMIFIQAEVVCAVLASEIRLQAGDAYALRFVLVSLRFLYLPNKARIHVANPPFQ